jgi:hypothetical protein
MVPEGSLPVSARMTLNLIWQPGPWPERFVNSSSWITTASAAG